MAEAVPIGECQVRLVNPARVLAFQAALPHEGVIDELAAMFGLLSDPGRVRLLASLAEGGDLCVCDLAATAGMGESAASHALRLLKAHGVVKARRSGRMMHYSLRDGHVRTILAVALEHVRHAAVVPETRS